MDNIVTYILVLSFVLVLSPYLSKLFKLPTAPIEIIIGSILAYVGLISVGESGNHYFDLIAEVGFLYLMFLAGLEISLKSLNKMPQEHLSGATKFLLILPNLALLVGYFILELNPIIIVALPLISVGLLATVSKEHGKSTQWVSIALLIGAWGEVFSITTLTILEFAVEVGFSMALILKLLLLLGFILIVLTLYYLFRLIFWWYPELKIVMMPPLDNKDQDLRLAMGIFFIMIAIMHLLHLDLAFGAFIAGLFISTFFHHKKELEDKMSSFGFGFLVPLFFIHVGASFDYNYFTESIGTAIKILTAMIMIRLLSSLSLVKIIGFKESILVALALSMPLTLLVAVATVGYHHEIITGHYYYAIILASLLEVIVSMIGIKYLTKKS
ncbi:cation:proton antiporter [Sulfurovum sp. bin170]|uniref:cation:proton antiporter n=1 Tax=Sulfurovum sp. bin170 TaxID=2695268 RepID=UPI0013DE9A9C|nr:cation:proton antiporter [Sulfurovum sp. bin170]NEW59762.1 cation:proton antiporter [Sulfurovum sp. bin170]